MKKLLLCCLTCFLMIGCTSNQTSSSGYYKNSSIKVSEIHDTDINQYEYLEDSDPPFIEINFEEALKFFQNKWSGILYFGHTGCPWCERAIPVLDEVAKKANIYVYYIDASKDISSDEDTSNKLMEEMGTYISESYQEDENGDKTFYVPNVVGVKNGKLVDFKTGLPDSYDINEKDQMSDAEKNELYKKYAEIFESVYS